MEFSNLVSIRPGPACNGEAGIKIEPIASIRCELNELAEVKIRAKIETKIMLTGDDIF